MSLNQRTSTFTLAMVWLVGGVACDAAHPTSSPAPSTASSTWSQPSQPSTPTQLSAPREPVLSELAWYQVDRLADTEGNEDRTLFAGTLAGDVTVQLPLASVAANDPDDVRTQFDQVGPQAVGIFSEAVLVWERAGNQTTLEVVNTSDGSLAPLSVSIAGRVITATANERLTKIYFVTAGAGGDLALWRFDVGERPEPTKLPFKFNETGNEYRLLSNESGSWVGIEADDGSAAFVDSSGGNIVEHQPGGPIIAMTGEAVLAYGRREDSGNRSVLALELPDGQFRPLAQGVSTALLASDFDGTPTCVIMRIDPVDVRNFEISAISLRDPRERPVYAQDTGELGAMLTSLDEVDLGFERSPGWVLLVDSFLPYVEPASGGRVGDPAQAPRLLNLETGELMPVGPFAPAE